MEPKKSLKELYFSKENDNSADLEKAGLKDKIKAGLVAGSSLLLSPPANSDGNKFLDTKIQQPQIQQPQIQQPAPAPKPEKPVFGETHLLSRAKEAGLHGKELAAFMAQTAHETLGFKRPKEIISDKKADKAYKGGKNYLGQGYIHLTHNYNYDKFGKMIGVDLLNNPHLASEPDTAAKVALAYWKTQVSPKVKNWDDVFQHSKLVNRPSAKTPAEINGYYDRVDKYNEYLDKLGIPSGTVVAEKSLQDHINDTLQKSLQEVKNQYLQDIIDEVLHKSLKEIT